LEIVPRKRNPRLKVDGSTIKMFIEVRNDTLIQRWPANENWQLAEKFNIEKYVRIK
jgi:hypothetical protein